MVILKDPLYGFINIDAPFDDLIETEYFQRLRNIKQLGQSYLIYPSANHSRFEHSIGAFYLAKKFTEKLKMEYKNEFIAAALLHDIGHYPFSHAIEKYIEMLNGVKHENQTLNLIKNTRIADILKKRKLNIGVIRDLILGKGKYGKLISGEIDVDRLDYLKRDSYYTGVAYGVIEIDVILKSISMKEKNYIADIKYLPAFESILISRYLMYSMVYMHHKTVIANAMLRAAFMEAFKEGEILIDDLFKYDDVDFIGILRNSRSAASKIIHQVAMRNFYEEAIIFKKDDLDDLERLKNLKAIIEAEKNIAAELGIKNYELLINILNFPKTRKSEILINPSGQNLEKISPIVKSLNGAEWNHWFIGVYCPKHCLKKVKAAKKMIKDCLLL